MTYKTPFLDLKDWDIHINANGNFRFATGIYAIAQNVANAIQLFIKDSFFEQESGIPHLETELGHKPPYSLLAYWIQKAALTVENVESAKVTIDKIHSDRVLQGYVEITTTTGETATVGI